MHVGILQWNEYSDMVAVNQLEATMTKVTLARYVASVGVNQELDLDVALQDGDLQVAALETVEVVIGDGRIAIAPTVIGGQPRTILLLTRRQTNRKRNQFVHFIWRANVLGETIAPTPMPPFHLAKWSSANSI